MVRLILLFVVLFFLSAFFSGTEVALMSMPDHKIDSLIKEGTLGAKTLKKIKEKSEKLLITILLGNNLVNVYTASLATKIAIQLADKAGFQENVAIGISTWVVTFLLLFFGEITPKTFCMKNSEKISLWVAKPYYFLMILFYPIIVFIEFVSKFFTWKDSSNKITEEEIESFLDMGKKYGTLEVEEHKKLKNLLEFNDISVENIMTPRVNMDAVNIESTVNEVIDFALSHTHTRLPVYSETIDNIFFVVAFRDLLREVNFWNSDKKLKEIKLEKIERVPMVQPINKVFDFFRSSRRHIAIVVDEYWGVAGVVTLEDIIEEVFGEIEDESDNEIEKVRKLNDYSYVFQSWVLMDEVLEYLGVNFSDLEEENFSEFIWETISYFITHRLQRFPYKEEKLYLYLSSEDDEQKSYIEFRILDIDNWKIEGVEINLVRENF